MLWEEKAGKEETLKSSLVSQVFTLHVIRSVNVYDV